VLLAATLAVLAAVVALGMVVRFGFGRSLGSALSPFVMGYKPDLAWPMAIAVALAAGLVAAVPRALRLPAPAFAAGLLAAALALALAINAGRNGPTDWDVVFRLGEDGSFEAINEYLPGLPALSYGVPFFLDRFAELVPTLPINVSGHPPGLLIVLHGLGLTTPARMAALCIACAAAVAPLTYALGRSLLAEPAARIAGLLAVACPCLLLFGTTSADAVYAAAGTAAAALLVARRPAARVAGVLALGLGTLLTWTLLAIAAWATLVALRREGPRRALGLAVLCGAGVLAVLGTLAGRYGYDPIGSLRALEDAYRASTARLRPYWFWVLGSPTAWMLMVGPPIVLAAVAAARRRAPAAMALAAVVTIAAVGGYTKAETERIWLPFVPLACVAAAEAGLATRRPRAVVGLLLAQAILVQALFFTVW
jgi:hypothetical protein